MEKVGALELQIEQLKLSASRADETAAELSEYKATTAIQLESLQEKLVRVCVCVQCACVRVYSVRACVCECACVWST